MHGKNARSSTLEQKTITSPNLQNVFVDWLGEVKKDLAKRGAFWNPTLVTQPINSRTLVLRKLLSESNGEIDVPVFEIHTDIRSNKWPELQQSPGCVLHFYCSKRRWQMKVEAEAVLSHKDESARATWENLSESAKKIYALKNVPGSPVEDPEAAYAFNEPEQGFENFGVVTLKAKSLESLQLSRPDRTDYHVRAKWDVRTNTYQFLAP